MASTDLGLGAPESCGSRRTSTVAPGCRHLPEGSRGSRSPSTARTGDTRGLCRSPDARPAPLGPPNGDTARDHVDDGTSYRFQPKRAPRDRIVSKVFSNGTPRCRQASGILTFLRLEPAGVSWVTTVAPGASYDREVAGFQPRRPDQLTGPRSGSRRRHAPAQSSAPGC